ncbi:lipocalin-like domain-containing protein [Gemmatimonas sp.]|uniref:lipocalin-like domain-containing protein n=1 Tax=Gemmatimonas sp. TaxID=1962908 RepID=UPI003983A137
MRLACTLLFICASTRVAAQSAASFVGDWRLISVLPPDSVGGSQPFWGPNPLGLIRYSTSGVMAAQLYDERRSNLGVGDWQDVTPTAAQAALIGLSSYYGTYTMDSIAKTSSHRVEGAMAPEWIGRTLVRGYRFRSENQIELRVITGPDGRPTTTGLLLVWDRVSDAPWRAVPAHREPRHHLVYENAFARVMEVRTPTGDTTGWHRHVDRMFSVVIAAARTWDQWVGRTPEPSAALPVGAVYDNGGWIPYTHRVGNVDTVAFQYVVATVKRRTGLSAPALRNVAHLALESDSTGARVYRITLAPGEATTSHRHIAPGLTIQIGSGSVRHEGTKPQASGAAFGAGGWIWRAAGHSHVMRNVGTVPVELIEIDWP